MLFMVTKTSILIRCVSPFLDYIYRIKAEGAILPHLTNVFYRIILVMCTGSSTCICIQMPVEARGIGSPGAGVTGSYDTGAEKRALVPAKAAS